MVLSYEKICDLAVFLAWLDRCYCRARMEEKLEGRLYPWRCKGDDVG